jgi:hypothetical protein
MSNQGGSKYVIDRIVGGGRVSYDAVGPEAPETSTSQERAWPAIPLEDRPPSPDIDNAVK